MGTLGGDGAMSAFKLAAWEQMANTISLYAYSIDSKNFEGLAQVFAPDGICYFPPPYTQMNGSAEIIKILQEQTEGITSQHIMATISIDVLDEYTATSHS